MHASRMSTARLLTVCLLVVGLGGCLVGCLSGGGGGVSDWGMGLPTTLYIYYDKADTPGPTL